MNEQDPQTHTPELIAHVPLQGVVEVTPVTEPAGEQLHGGYATGITVGQTANKIARLQEAGRYDEANALAAKLNEVSPGIPVPSETEQ